MGSNGYAIGGFAALVLVAGTVTLADAFAPGHRWWVLALAVACSAGLAWMLAIRLRRQAEDIGLSVRSLPLDRAAAINVGAPFASVYAAVQLVSTALKLQLGNADKDRQELVALLDSMQDAVLAVDAAGRIQWTNERMRRLLPGPVGQAGGPGNVQAGGQAGVQVGLGSVRIGQALVHTVRDPEVLECVALAIADKTLTVRRSTSLVPGRLFEVNASPIPGGGAVAVLHDVTRIEEVERTQKDFIANVSHELRTPLTSIQGYVETLLDHEDLSVQAKEFLGTILKNASRMNRLTEDLLVIARVETPALELNPAPVPADSLVRDAVKAMRGLVQENEASLEIDEVTSVQVFADADAVMQVLGNLIENAIKYGPPRNGSGGGPRDRVVLRAREVTSPYDAVEFSVQDFGAGIASEHLTRIFERFYRVDKTRSRDSGGTGLGLAIARHMVHTQGGAIWAESELGVGSRFLFTLPRALFPVAAELSSERTTEP